MFCSDKGKGPPVKAHRFMLVQQSSYFHGMFLRFLRAYSLCDYIHRIPHHKGSFVVLLHCFADIAVMRNLSPV